MQILVLFIVYKYRWERMKEKIIKVLNLFLDCLDKKKENLL